MDPPRIGDGQVLFDRSLQAAGERIADLHASAAPGHGRTGRSGIRRALGVRLLRLGAALLANDPGRVERQVSHR